MRFGTFKALPISVQSLRTVCKRLRKFQAVMASREVLGTCCVFPSCVKEAHIEGYCSEFSLIGFKRIMLRDIFLEGDYYHPRHVSGQAGA